MNQELIWNIESLWARYCAENTPVNNSLFEKSGDLTDQSEEFFTLTDSLDTLKVSDQAAFTDDYGSYPGLAKDVVMYQDSKPHYVFDNHNKALLAFLALKEQTNTLLNIIHIDAHPDDAIFSHDIDQITRENVSEIYKKSRISDFLDCARKGQLIKSLKRITTEGDFNEKPLTPPEPFVLSLDIDIFGPEGAFTNLESKIRTLAHYWHHASAITIATSPGFIDQEDALTLIKIFMQNSAQK